MDRPSLARSLSHSLSSSSSSSRFELLFDLELFDEFIPLELEAGAGADTDGVGNLNLLNDCLSSSSKRSKRLELRRPPASAVPPTATDNMCPFRG